MAKVRNTAGSGRAARVRTLPVADKAALARVLGEIEHRCGSQVQAARELGPISALHFWRLRHARGGKRIGRKLFEAIKRKAQEGKRPAEAEIGRLALEAAVVAPGNLARLNQYSTWLRANLRRHGAEVLLLLGKGGRSRLSYGPDFERRLETLLDLEKRFGSYFRGMERRARREGHLPLRILLAKLRAIEELRDSERSAGIERHLSEWRDTDLRIFLRAALRKEEMLLDRDRDVERAVLEALPSTRAPRWFLKTLDLT